MTIKEDKARLIIVIEKTLLAKIKEKAEKEKRSMSNMAAFILEKYFESEK